MYTEPRVVDWDDPWYDRLRWLGRDEAAGSDQGKLAIVGLPGAGKKTLCNSLWGWQAVGESSEAFRSFGTITLADLPLNPYDASSILYRLERVNVILYLLDASQPLHPDDFGWIARLRALDVPLIIAANKIDQVSKAEREQVMAELAEKLARPVLPLVACDPALVQRRFVPALLKTCPELSESLGAEISALRYRVALRLILQTAFTGAMLYLSTGALNDGGSLVQLQTHLLRRIGSLYGRRGRTQRLFEMMLSLGLRAYVRFARRLSTRFPKAQPWMVHGAIAAISTLLIGWAAMLYYGTMFSGRLVSKRKQSDHAAYTP